MLVKGGRKSGDTPSASRLQFPHQLTNVLIFFAARSLAWRAPATRNQPAPASPSAASATQVSHGAHWAGAVLDVPRNPDAPPKRSGRPEAGARLWEGHAKSGNYRCGFFLAPQKGGFGRATSHVRPPPERFLSAFACFAPQPPRRHLDYRLRIFCWTGKKGGCVSKGIPARGEEKRYWHLIS